MDAHDITALRNDIAVARGQQTKPRTHGAFFADGLQVISVVQNTEKRCELMLLQAESSGLYDVVSKCMPAHSFRLFLRTKRVSICSCHLCFRIDSFQRLILFGIVFLIKEGIYTNNVPCLNE